ncbi:DUF1931 domain-containing protein [Candidatus Woesearchaeota archaeon]|nr:DUF1931 domain-containing protein [Candidatus Woesearchaeota archaeon]
MGSDIIVHSKIKEYAKYEGKPLNVAGDFAPALSKKVIAMIEEASKRAKLNGRNTVMGKDI